MQIDTHKPCPSCGKPFDDRLNAYEMHVYGGGFIKPCREGMVSLHDLYCPCGKCITVRQKEKGLREK